MISRNDTFVDEVKCYPHPQQWQLCVKHHLEPFLSVYLYFKSETVRYVRTECTIQLVNQQTSEKLDFKVECRRVDAISRNYGCSKFVKLSEIEKYLDPQDATLTFFVYMNVVEQCMKPSLAGQD
jgi:hypothetical protein